MDKNTENMTRQKEQEDKAENETHVRKGESSDSPEIPDRRDIRNHQPPFRKDICACKYF